MRLPPLPFDSYRDRWRPRVRYPRSAGGYPAGDTPVNELRPPPPSLQSLSTPPASSAQQAIDRLIARLVEKQIAKHHAEIEAACLDAITGGQHGVLVNGLEVSVDPRVPYGHIYYGLPADDPD